MAPRIVLRVERDGQVLGSWSLNEQPLTMSMVDLGSGSVLARFTAAGPAAPTEGVDEIPFALARIEDDDFTMPLPEPTRSATGRNEPRGGQGDRPDTQEGPRSRPGMRNLAQETGDGLTAFLIPTDEESTVTRRSPLPATSSPPAPAPAPPRPTEVESTARPSPAEVWTQKRGQWRNLGPLIAGQRVSTLGGWVRLSPDGRLVVSSGGAMSGTATLIDGRMIEIEAGRENLALPPGSSVMLAAGDRGLYVRSEPLPG